MEPQKSRGRARGRARSVDQSAPPRGPAPRGMQRGGPGPSRPPQQQPPSWAAQQAPPPTQQQYQQRAPAPVIPPAVQGRAAMRQTSDKGLSEEMEGLTLGVAEGGATCMETIIAGRGSMRGRRLINTSETLMTRPSTCNNKHGSTGTPIRLQANYFAIQTRKDWNIYQYRVDFTPDVDGTGMRRKLFSTAFKEKLAGYLFEGTLLFASERISPDPMEVFVKKPGDDGDPIRITVRNVGILSDTDYHMIQVFNIIMRNCLRALNLQLVGRNFYDPAAKIKINQYSIELWPGYVTSIRQHQNQLLMCCEISHKFMRLETVLNVINEAERYDSRNYRMNLNSQLLGCIVLTDYNNRTYRITDIDWDQTPACKFPRKDGSQISYIEYYRQRYQINIKVANQPLLVSRSRERDVRAGLPDVIYLIPELCRMTGLTDSERGNMSMMRALAEYTRIGPDKRIDRLLEYSHRMHSKPEIVAELQRWEMKMSTQLVDVPGRVFPQESIIQGSRADIRYESGLDTDWTRKLRSNPMLTVGRIDTWVVLCPAMLKRDAVSFVQSLQRAAGGMNFRLPDPQLIELADDRTGAYTQALTSCLVKYQPSIVFCVVSNNNRDRYSAIKKVACLEKPCPTQVILKRNISGKSQMSVATKVAVQMNCKIGGAPWTVEVPLSNLMVIGYDVCHDTYQKSKSFGAIVATLDRQCTRYFNTVSAHTSGEELSNDFALNIIKALRIYRECNQALPERLLIYRDGVGEGQLEYVYQHELQRINQAIKEFYGERQCKSAFIVVTKRTNTRLFLNKNQNPPPGTVVDDVITLPIRYDFFIVSQCVRQGTVSPTNYNVLYDTLGLPPDRLQRLTYKFCHAYFNWSGTVRVPAPCQYAHKLAFLAGQSLHRKPHERLENLLYFL